MILGKGSKDDHSMEFLTLILFSLGEVERSLQLLYIDADKGCLRYKERYGTPICEVHHTV